MAQSILVPQCVSEKVVKRLSRLAKDAGVELTVVPGTSVIYRKVAVTKETKDSHRKFQVLELDTTAALECIRITIEDMPKCNGFEFVGKLVHTEAGNLIAMAGSAQNEPTPEEWRTAKPTCDHCKTKRTRKDTFIIKCPDGSIKRIGRNCLADFLITDPGQLIAVAVFEDMLRDLDAADEEEWGSMGGGFSWAIATDHYLACAVASIDRRGFFKSGSDEQTTKQDAAFLAGRCPTGHDVQSCRLRDEWKANQPKAEHHARAVELALWLEANEDKSDYIYNLKVGLSLPVVRRETEGLIASAPQAYNRHLGQIAERKARETQVDAGYMGELKQRLVLPAIVVNVRVIQSEGAYGYGSSRLTTLKTPHGHEVVTWTDLFSENDIGKTVRIKATVSKHSMFKGKHQTTVNRAVLVEETEEANV
jgi:hypothetical protein